MKEEILNQKLRQLPSVEELLETPQLKKRIEELSHLIVTSRCREVMARFRENVLNGDSVPPTLEIVTKVEKTLDYEFSFMLQKVINGTGIIMPLIGTAGSWRTK